MSKTTHEGRNHFTSLKLEPLTLDSKKVDSENDLVNKHGQMVSNTLESDKKIESMEKVDSSMLMATFKIATGLTTKQMAEVFTNSSTVQSTRVSRRMISNTVTVSRHRQTSQSASKTTPSDESMESVATNGMMDQFTQETIVKINF